MFTAREREMERDLRRLSENRLYDASAIGDERSLQELLEQDPLLLSRVSYTCSDKAPLHVATIRGHIQVVRAILNHDPDLAQELDSHHSSALHVASYKGYLEIARELLSAAPDMCLVRDCQRRNPLHLAAMKGHVEVLEELIQSAPGAARVKLERGMTVLHLCVECRQLEALKILVPYLNELVNAKGDDGDTLLHMAVRDRQTETINYLLSITSLDVNQVNLNGMTAVDILTESTRDVRDSEIEESEWLDQKRGSIMVVASLIATMSFQVGVNPPGGVWQDNSSSHNAGFSIQAENDPDEYNFLYITNTICFLASLSTILLLMSGLPLRRRFFIWILMMFIWTAIIAAALFYVKSVMLFTPLPAPPNEISFAGILMFWVRIWCFFMFFLVFGGHAIRLIVKLIKWLTKSVMRMAAGPAVLVPICT